MSRLTRAGGRAALVGCVIGALLLTAVTAVTNARLYRAERDAEDLTSALRFLGDRLRDGAGERMQEYFPEGYFFSHVLYGLAWLEVGRDSDQKKAAVREARWALRRLESPKGRAPFAAAMHPAHGVFHAGWTSRLRGGIVELVGPGAAETARFRADCAEIAQALRTSGPFLEAYPGQAWPVDTVVAVSALGLHDRILDPAYRRVRESWVRAAGSAMDPRTGLLPHQVRPAWSGARGSSQSVVQRFLPEIDEEWAQGQYARFRDVFVTTELGLPGVREYPPGTEGEGDVDSGPLILGVSISATAVTLGAARAHGDLALAGPLTGLGEAAGLPVEIFGRKRYALGLLPVGDAFLTWSAATPVGRPPGAPQREPVVSWWWRLPWHLLGVGLVYLAWMPAWRLRRRGRDRVAADASRSGEAGPWPSGRERAVAE